MKVTKQGQLLEALRTGSEFTASQISETFGIKNPTAAVSSLRFAGYAVYANQRKSTDGSTVTRYRLGTPSRKVVAAGYRALASGITA